MRSHACCVVRGADPPAGKSPPPLGQVAAVSRDDTPGTDPFYPPRGGVVERIEN